MRAVSLSSLVSVVLMAIPAGASAQSAPSDPEADSPSGVVYELPVDRARKDAAPKRRSSQDGGGSESGGGSPGGGSGGDGSSGGSGGEGAAAGESELSIRSENNFGTSSNVPGADGAGGARRGQRRDRGAADVPGEEDAGGPIEDLGQLAPSSAASASEGPSDGVVFLLLGALVAVGTGIGVVVGRRAMRGRRG
jgi:hypothetical protein